MGVFENLSDAVNAFTDMGREAAESGHLERLNLPMLPAPVHCGTCQLLVDRGDEFCDKCGIQNRRPHITSCYTFVKVKHVGDKHTYSVPVTDMAGAKAALREMRAIRRAVTNLKRDILEGKRNVRAEHTRRIRGQAFVGKTADQKQIELAYHLKPLETEQLRVDEARVAIEQTIVELKNARQSFLP